MTKATISLQMLDLYMLCNQQLNTQVQVNVLWCNESATPPTKFGKYNYQIGSCVKDVAQESLQEAVEEAVVKNKCHPGVSNPRDLTIALDGTWQKWAHTSHNAVITATNYTTNTTITASANTTKIVVVTINSNLFRCPK